MRIAILLLVIPIFSFSQVGSWYDFLSYKQGSHVVQLNDNIVCAAGSGLVFYSRTDSELSVISRISGLSDARIQALAAHKSSGTIIVGYASSNIDLVRNDEIINLPDIVNSGLFGKKTINDILVIDDLAYISCGFGIVVLDILKEEIKETYFIGPNASQIDVQEMCFTGTKLYAATAEGVFSADYNNPNLIDFNNWTFHSSLPAGFYNTITNLGEQIIVNQQNPLFNTDTVYTFDGTSWSIFGNFSWSTRNLTSINNQVYASHHFSIIQYDENGEVLRVNGNNLIPGVQPAGIIVDEFGHNWIADVQRTLIHNWFGINVEILSPDSPGNSGAYRISAHDNKILIAGGSINTSWNNTFSSSGAHYFNGTNWTFYKPEDLEGSRDMITAYLDPDNGRLFTGSWNNGAIELGPNGMITRFHDGNSSLQERPNDTLNYIRVGGIDKDSLGRYWFSNSETVEPLSMLNTNGEWTSYSLSPYITSDNLSRELLIDATGFKWIFKRRDGLVVFNDNGTPFNKNDDKIKHLTTQLGQGNLPSDEVLSIEEDLDGEIWVGTAAGVVVFYNPDLIFEPSGDFIDAQPVLIQVNGLVNKLLDEERVTAIAVDGANRKWFGTASGGVFYFSQDGTQQLLHFTQENSPLLSNSILDIEIDPVTGFVYVATDRGVLAYLGEAIEPRADLSGVYAFPNPVRPEHVGPIGITGLVRDASVKITDINGSLVFETTSSGGRAIWHGNTLDGDRVSTGVYLVYITNFDGSQTLVSKIAVVR